MNKRPLIGILAIQGGYDAHAKILKQLGFDYILVVSTEQLHKCDGLILPGGESLTILKFISTNGLFEQIIHFSTLNKPILGTCAGAILLAKKVINPIQNSLGLIDMTVARNGYGRQYDSCILTGQLLCENFAKQDMMFIRAPKIINFGDKVTVTAKCDGEIVGVEQKNCLATTFHPELLNISYWHQYLFSRL